MKKILSIAIIASISLAATAANESEEKGRDAKQEIFSKPKFSGYLIGQYSASLKEGDKSNSFNLRMIRLTVSGRLLNDFEWRIQGQINGNTSRLGESPRIVDCSVEWQKYDQLRIKAGQFKRPFTFENPMNPIDQGFMSYSQNTMKLSGFNDRTGESASNGRDIGVQVSGDVLPDATGRPLLHYAVGVFNGQGINHKDVDNRKDVIGGVWVSPFKGMRIGAFGWVGSYARDGKWTDANGEEQSGVRSVSRYRYALSAEWKDDDWQIRSEYIHHTGGAFATTYQNSSNASDAEYSTSLGNRADGIYALCIAPIVRKKLRAKARYDLYRQNAEWGTARTQYEIGLNYLFCKNMEIQAEYAFVNDRTLAADKHNYSQFDIQFSVRF